MPVVKKFDVGPELLGNWVYEASSKNQTRENVGETNKLALNYAELNQRGALAGAELNQRAIERNMNAAQRAEELNARIAENRFDAQNRLDLEKLQNQTQDARLEKAGQNQLEQIQLRDTLDRAAKAESGITVPDFTEGGIQNHEMAIANQRLAGFAGQTYQRELLAKIAAGDPIAIKQGISEGLMRFTPEQKQKAIELQNALSQIMDPNNKTLTVTDRARGEAMIKAQLAAIQPQLVPEDERMADINTQATKEIGIWSHPITKKQYPIVRDRSGVLEILDTKDDKPIVQKPLTIRERIQVDPAFHAAQLREAYKRVEERKRDDYEVAKESALLHGTAVPPYSPPGPQEVHDELNEMVSIADYQNEQFGGGGATLPNTAAPSQQQPGMPPAAMPPAGPMPEQLPAGVDEAVQSFAAASGIPVAPAAGKAQLPQSRFGQKVGQQPAATPKKPLDGLTDDLAKSLIARVKKYREQAQKQGGLDANDYAHYVAICNDLGIEP